MRRFKGFSMIEMVSSIALLALIVIAVAKASMAIDALRVQTRETVYLSLHNLNVMERLRQMCLENSDGIMLFYGDAEFGTLDVETEAFLKEASIDNFKVYKVRIESKTRDTNQRLTSEYIITDIGAYEEDT